MKPQSKKKLLSVSDLINREISKTLRESNLISLQEKEGASTAESTGAEEVIAILIRNQSVSDSEIPNLMKNPGKNADFAYLKDYFLKRVSNKLSIEQAIERVTKSMDVIKSFRLPASAEQYGTKQSKPVPEWFNAPPYGYGGEDRPINAKTDVLNSNFHHSVKERGPIQMLDASPKQCAALVLYALDNSAAIQVINTTLGDIYETEFKEIEAIAIEMQNTDISLTRIPDEKVYRIEKDAFFKKNPNAPESEWFKHADDDGTKSPRISPEAKELVRKAKLEPEKFEPRLRVSGGEMRGTQIRKGGKAVSPEAMSEGLKKQLKLFNKKLKDLDNMVQNIFTSANLATSGDFKKIFLRESLTGEFMFGQGQASANSMIEWTKGFNEVKKVSIEDAVSHGLNSFQAPKFGTKPSKTSISPKAKVAADMSKANNSIISVEKGLETASYKPTSIRKLNEFKSNQQLNTSGIGRLSTIIEYTQYLVSEYDKNINNIKESLNENKLNEFDFTAAVERAKELGGDVWKKIQDVFSWFDKTIAWVVKKINEFISGFKEIIGAGIRAIFAFFGLEIDIEPGYKVEVRF